MHSDQLTENVDVKEACLNDFGGARERLYNFYGIILRAMANIFFSGSSGDLDIIFRLQLRGH